MTEVKNIKWNFSSYTDAKGRTYIISYYNQWDSEKKQVSWSSDSDGESYHMYFITQKAEVQQTQASEQTTTE